MTNEQFQPLADLADEIIEQKRTSLNEAIENYDYTEASSYARALNVVLRIRDQIAAMMTGE